MNRSRNARSSVRLLALTAAGAGVAAVMMAAPRPPASPAARSAAGRPGFVYFGTYTGEKSRGIYVASWDAAAGKVGPVRLGAETPSPSFLTLHPTRPLLYAVNEVDDFGGEKAGSVSAFAIDPATGDLRALGRPASTKGGSPCHLVVDPSGRYVLAANYGGGSVAVLPIAADGSVGEATGFVRHQGSGADPKRQKAPHAHMVSFDPAHRLALVADLGLDQVLLYRFDAGHGRLEPSDPPFARVAPASGPRHFAFSPDGRDLYVDDEMKVDVTAFKYGGGKPTSFQTLSALPAGTTPGPEDSGAEIAMHPSGRFVYASNRGPDTIAVFSRDAATGMLTLLESVPTGGRTPRNFAIDPSGHFLLAANQRGDSVVVFRIDEGTGRLTPTGQKVEVGAPVCVSFFVPTAR